MERNIRENPEWGRKDWLRYHAHMLASWLARTSPDKEPARGEATQEEVAFEILRHCALVQRYGGPDTLNDEMASVPPDVWHWLVLAAARYMETVAFEQQAQEIIRADALSDEDMEAAEDLLIMRDWCEAAWQLAREKVKDRIETDRNLVAALARALSAISAGDELLRSRPDVIGVASRILEPFLQMAHEAGTVLSPRDYWWMFEARQADRAFEEEANAFSRMLAEAVVAEQLAAGQPGALSKLRAQLLREAAAFTGIIAATLDQLRSGGSPEPLPALVYASPYRGESAKGPGRWKPQYFCSADKQVWATVLRESTESVVVAVETNKSSLAGAAVWCAFGKEDGEIQCQAEVKLKPGKKAGVWEGEWNLDAKSRKSFKKAPYFAFVVFPAGK